MLKRIQVPSKYYLSEVYLETLRNGIRLGTKPKGTDLDMKYANGILLQGRLCAEEWAENET